MLETSEPSVRDVIEHRETLTTDGRVRLESLTSLRFFAAFMVLCHHSAIFYLRDIPPVRALARPGFIGVAFFFVLSGFVLTWSYKPSLPNRTFYWRRFARIYPLHITTLIVAFFVLEPDWGGSRSVRTIAENVFLLQAWSPIERTSSVLNGVSWTLACEAFFYALFPFLFVALSRCSNRALARIVVLGVVAVFAFDVVMFQVAHGLIPGTVTTKNPLLRLPEFVTGMCLALALQRGVRFNISMRTALLVAGATYVFLGYVSAWDTPRFGFVWPGFLQTLTMLPAIVLIILAAAQRDMEGRRGVLQNRVLVLLGASSFALYMIHYVPMLYVRQYETWGLNDPHVLQRTLIEGSFALIAITASIVVYSAFERPVEKRLRKLSRSGRG